mmetsp:Transcript_14071/g.42556  ORF Transcript_14071/g.42556 Transcript_14071/m.42556 type:complete len:119 (-) Transcript_14071:234-590(-)
MVASTVLETLRPVAKWTEEVLAPGSRESSDTSSEKDHTEQQPPERKAQAPQNPIIDPLVRLLLNHQIQNPNVLDEPPVDEPAYTKKQAPKHVAKPVVDKLPRNYRALDNKKAYGRRKA